METIGPNPGKHEASAGLDIVADAQRAVRDRPWPIWLYPINALALGGLALSGLLESSILAMAVVVILGVGMPAVNYWAGRLIGTPFAIPTSRGFRGFVVASGIFVILSLPARAADLEWAVIGCAAGATIAYGLGSVVHYRSTH